MPSKSKAQSRYMHGIASGSIKPGKSGPSKAVARDFVSADAGKSQAKLPERKAPPISDVVAPKRGGY
jgi:hypothetical protein